MIKSQRLLGLFLFAVLSLCSTLHAQSRAGWPHVQPYSGTLPEISLAIPVTTQQTNYTCGPASLLSVLKFYAADQDLNETTLADNMQTSPFYGTPLQNMERELKDQGLKAKWKNNATWNDLKQILLHGKVAIIAYTDEDIGHYVVLTGMDSDDIYIMDPWPQVGVARVSREDFELSWYINLQGSFYSRSIIIVSRK